MVPRYKAAIVPRKSAIVTLTVKVMMLSLSVTLSRSLIASSTGLCVRKERPSRRAGSARRTGVLDDDRLIESVLMTQRLESLRVQALQRVRLVRADDREQGVAGDQLLADEREHGDEDDHRNGRDQPPQDEAPHNPRSFTSRPAWRGLGLDV